MKRRMQDAINCSTTQDFTIIPNTILKNNSMSSKAKMIIALLLSNKNGWTTYKAKLLEYTKEGESAIEQGIRELEKFGYLKRIRYRDIKTKQWKGSFWMYTDNPYHFNIGNKLETLSNQGLEPQPDFPYVEKPDVENHLVENHPLIILNNNIKDYNKTKTNNILSASAESTTPIYEPFIPQAKQLAKIIQSSKNINITKQKINSWANSIRLMNDSSRGDGIELNRIQSALDWYANNIGGDYIPVIESGKSFRDKFIKLENAMNRKPIQKQNNKDGSRNWTKSKIEYPKGRKMTLPRLEN